MAEMVFFHLLVNENWFYEYGVKLVVSAKHTSNLVITVLDFGEFTSPILNISYNIINILSFTYKLYLPTN